MVAIKLPTFAGMVPAIDKHLLADQNAQNSNNVWLYSGALVGLPAKAKLHDMADPAATVAFRVPINASDPTYLYNSYWKEFQNANTDFIAAPVQGDTFQRYYWTSTSEVPKYNTLARMQANQPAWLLGLPQPANINVVASGGSSSTLVSRAYLTTLVSAYGEEGPASNPFVINGKIDDNYTITVGAVLAGDMGVNRNVSKIRIYRTITSAAGTATYYLVAELNASTSTQNYVDNVSDAVLASKPILESTAWTAPPQLQGMCVMPNGIIAGYIGKDLYFSEAYRPHAWPVAYSLSLDFEVVGMAVVNQTLVICTKGTPYTASGVNPASIVTSKIASFEPCLSKGSIVPSDEGVYYTSPNGLILCNAGFAQNLTKQYITRDKWNEIVNYGAVNAARFAGAYYAFGTGVVRAFDDMAFQNDAFQMKTGTGASGGFLLDPQNANVGFTFMTETSDVVSVKNDMMSGEVLFVTNGAVYWLDQRPGFQVEPYKWRSKVFQTPELKNFSAMKTYFYDPTTPITFITPEPNVSLNQVYDPAHQYAVVRIYADGKLIAARELRHSGQLLRLPSEYKAEFWEIEFEGIVKIKNFQMATSVKELSVV